MSILFLHYQIHRYYFNLVDRTSVKGVIGWEIMSSDLSWKIYTRLTGRIAELYCIDQYTPERQSRWRALHQLFHTAHHASGPKCEPIIQLLFAINNCTKVLFYAASTQYILASPKWDVKARSLRTCTVQTGRGKHSHYRVTVYNIMGIAFRLKAVPTSYTIQPTELSNSITKT